MSTSSGPLLPPPQPLIKDPRELSLHCLRGMTFRNNFSYGFINIIERLSSGSFFDELSTQRCGGAERDEKSKSNSIDPRGGDQIFGGTFETIEKLWSLSRRKFCLAALSTTWRRFN
jgi:hypothetical protein